VGGPHRLRKLRGEERVGAVIMKERCAKASERATSNGTSKGKSGVSRDTLDETKSGIRLSPLNVQRG